MKYEGICFNEKFVKKFTEKDFVNDHSNQHLWPNITQEQRIKRLKEVHKLIKIK